MLILFGMLWSRSSRGKEGMSPSSMRARLNAVGDSGSGIGSNDMRSEEVFLAVVVSGETSIWFCWLAVPGSPGNFEVSSSGGREEEANDLFASSGVFGETDEESSAITSKKPAGLDAETVCPSYEL